MSESGERLHINIPIGGVHPINLASRHAPLPKPAHLVMAADLPAPLRDLILHVLDRSGLWRSEQSDLACELIAHFADGLERGETEQAMVNDFGDADQAAKLIRRAKKRNRPWPWRAGRAILLALLVMIVCCGLLLVRFYVGEPTISHDYREDLNREASKVKAEDAAWPVYRKALLQLPSISKVLGNDPDPLGVRPGEPWWPKCRQFVIDHADALETARQAAAKPAMGLRVGQTLNEEELQLWPYSAPDSHFDPERGVFSILLPHLGNLRVLAMTLAVDCRRALDEGDEVTAVRDLEAIIGIARHVRETPIFINDLVSLAILQMAFERVMEVIPAPQGKGFDSELDGLAAALDSVDDELVHVRPHGERYGFEDLIQRMYTDDGEGDGRITPKGLRVLDDVIGLTSSVTVGQGPARQPSWQEAIATVQPVRGLLIAGRKEMLAEHDRLMTRAETDAVTPLWLRGEPVCDQQLSQWMASPTDRIRYLPLVLLMPALGKASVRGELVRQSLDATRTVVALERFRRQNGAWPQTLDELVPSFLNEVPKDRFDGQPLKYRIGDDGPVLYSVGADRVDDNGVPPTDGNDPCRFIPAKTIAGTKKVGGTIHGLAAGDWVLYPPPVEPLRTEPAPEEASE